MNEDPRLPENLAELERELAARPLPEPSHTLRGRVLTALQKEADVPCRAAERGGLLPYVAAVAALLLACMNLSMSAVNGMDRLPREEPERRNIASQARSLQRILPDLPDEEARRMARVMAAGRPLPFLPRVEGRLAWTVARESTQINSIYGEMDNGTRAAVD